MAEAVDEKSLLWRKPFGAAPSEPAAACCMYFGQCQQSLQPAERIIQVQPDVLKVFGLFPGKTVLLRELGLAWLQSVLKQKHPAFLCACSFEDKVLVAVKMDKQLSPVILSFGLFDEHCQILRFSGSDGQNATTLCILDMCYHEAASSAASLPLLYILSNSSVRCFSNNRLVTFELPAGFIPVGMKSMMAMEAESVILAISGKDGKWLVVVHHAEGSNFSLIGEYEFHEKDDDAAALIDDDLGCCFTFSQHPSSIAAPSRVICLFVGTKKRVFLQRISLLDEAMIESREVVTSAAAKCAAIGVFAHGTNIGRLPLVVALQSGDSIEFRIVVIHNAFSGNNMICEDIGSDVFTVAGDQRVVDSYQNEASLELYILQSDGSACVYSGLTLRNSWRQSLQPPFDFTAWFDLFAPFPYSPTFVAHYDEYSIQLDTYPPKGWSELRAIIDKLLQPPLVLNSLLLIYYMLLDFDAKAASRFAWEYGLSVEETRRVRRARMPAVNGAAMSRRQLLQAKIDKFGISSCANNDDCCEMVAVVLADLNRYEKEFLDCPFDASSLEMITHELRRNVEGNEHAAGLLVKLLFYRSRYSEALETAKSVAAKTPHTKSLLSSLSAMLTGSHLTKTPFRQMKTDERRTIIPLSPKKTPVKVRTPSKRSDTRHFTPVPLVSSPNAGRHAECTLSAQHAKRLTRQPSVVSLATPRHHPSLTPSRLGKAAAQAAADDEDQNRSRSPPGRVLSSPPRRQHRSLSPARQYEATLPCTPHKQVISDASSPIAAHLRRSPRLLEKRQSRLEQEGRGLGTDVPRAARKRMKPLDEEEEEQKEGGEGVGEEKEDSDGAGTPPPPPPGITLRRQARAASSVAARHSPRLSKK